MIEQLPVAGAIGMPSRLVCGVSADWYARHAAGLRAAGIAIEWLDDSDALAATLATDWSVDAVVLDLAYAVPALATRFGPGGPRLVAFGDAAHAGFALAAHRVDFIDEDDDTAALVAILAQGDAPAAGVADLSEQINARRGALGAEAERVAHALARLERSAEARAAIMVAAATVRRVIRTRRARDRFFPAQIFGDPAWDMLLDLFAAHLAGDKVSVSSLCIAAAVPTSTALRWIKTLCDVGLFDRQPDPADARRAYIGLSAASIDGMRSFFAVGETALVA